MKYFIIGLSCVLFINGVKAQSQEIKRDRWFIFASGHYTIPYNSNTSGEPTAGAGFQYIFNKNNNKSFFVAGLEFNRFVVKHASDFRYSNIEHNLTNISLPFAFHFKVNKTLFMEAGGIYHKGLEYAGKRDVFILYPNGGPNIRNEEFKNGYEKGDIAGQIGFGLRAKIINQLIMVRARYSHGLINIHGSNDFIDDSRTFQRYISINFGVILK